MQKPVRKIIFEIGEGNKILNHTVLDLNEETEKYEHMQLDLGETLHYLYDFCDGLAVMLKYEDEQEREARRMSAEAEFEFSKFWNMVYHEAYEQCAFDPAINMKAFFLNPILRLLIRINETESSNKIVNKIVGAIKDQMPFISEKIDELLFGKENAKQIRQLIEEGRKKFFLEQS